MRINGRRLIAGANLVRHGATGLAGAAVRGVRRAVNAATPATPKPVKGGSPFAKGFKPKNTKTSASHMIRKRKSASHILRKP